MRCRIGYWQEEIKGKVGCDTPGKEIRSEPVIIKDRKGVKHLTMKQEYSKWIVQHSRLFLLGWRANVDCQLIIYRLDPNCPNIAEIEGVCRYVVAYARKRYIKTLKYHRKRKQFKHYSRVSSKEFSIVYFHISIEWIFNCIPNTQLSSPSSTSKNNIGAEVKSITKKFLSALSSHCMVPIQ